MKMMYISHPFTGNEEENAADAKSVKKTLQLTYPNVCFVNPLDEFGDNEKLDYCTALSLAMELLSRCDGIIFCRNWEKSTGCRAEMAYAKKTGMEIKHLSEYGITEAGVVSDSDTGDKGHYLPAVKSKAVKGGVLVKGGGKERWGIAVRAAVVCGLPRRTARNTSCGEIWTRP